MGAAKHLSTSESEELRPKLKVGKLQIGSQKDNDIRIQVLRTAATVENKKTTDRRPASVAERFSFQVASWFGSRNGRSKKVINM